MENDVLLKILPDILRNIISNLPRNFDSHAVIDVLDQKFPLYYSELKREYNKKPERAADSIIARTLAKSDFLEATKTGEVQDSLNIKGNVTPNHCWRKKKL